MQAEQLSWEEIVNRVTIAANYREVTRSAGAWGMAFRRSIALHSSLERLKNKSTSWKGGAADAFRAHVGKLADAAEQNVLAHERVAVHIDACASHLERAIRAIPIPSWKFAEVRQKQVAFAQNGVLQEMGAGEFWNGLLDWMHRQTAGAPLGAAALQEAEDFFRMGEQRARAAYQKLCADYALEMAGMPRGTPVAVPGVKPGEGGRSRGNGAQPKTAAATNPATAPANPLTNPLANTTPPAAPPASPTLPDDSVPDFPGLDDPELPPIERPGFDPLDPLDPFDPFNPGDSPGGGPKLPGGGSALAGVGRLGGAGSLPPIGDAFSPPESMVAALNEAGAGQQARVGGTPGGNGTPGFTGAPVAGGGGYGAGQGGEGGVDADGNLLREDSDILSPHRWAPPGVLRG
ncbi:hypothetical protein GCM10022251_25450 [Phytohabitans flavus]|uniref:hypothetical protein n=1 Tax=Phytohabitans flavus TaxID=1076124 RepID=UPI0031EEBF1B